MQPMQRYSSRIDQCQMKCLKEAYVSCINPISGSTTKVKISMKELHIAHVQTKLRKVSSTEMKMRMNMRMNARTNKQMNMQMGYGK